MNKYFWTWLGSCILYALGLSILVITERHPIFSVAYIGNEIAQIGALLCILYACNQIDNLPQNFFGLKYGALLTLFFVIYGIAHAMSENFYIAMLIFKLIVVIMVVYTIVVKWRFSLLIKATSITLLGTSGIYLCLYDFLIYEMTGGNKEILVYVCVGILFLVFQNFNLAVLYRIQSRNQEKLQGDYLTVFAENSADLIFYYTISPYPRFSFVSPAAKTMLGYSPQAFYSNSKLHLELAVEEDREQMEKLFGEFEGNTYQCEVKAERRDGETVNLECYATKIRVNGKTVAVEGILRDITQRVATEKKIRENNKNRQLMLSYISHDLKTPITYILAYSEAIQKNIIKSEEEMINAISSIHNKANSLAKLVEDISLLSKLEASRFNYEFEEIRCIELAANLRDLHESDFKDGIQKYGVVNRNYSFEIHDSMTNEEQILVDVKRIEQVFENLIINAVKVTEDRGTIHVVCGLEKNCFYFSVKDNGLGIKEEERPYIFENFYRGLETKKRAEGSGLGLSLSHQIVMGHGGKITVESKEGQGSCFTVEIPVFKTRV